MQVMEPLGHAQNLLNLQMFHRFEGGATAPSTT
jgi:hypothetical protein